MNIGEANHRLLLIESDATYARLIRGALEDARNGPFLVEWTEKLSEGLERLSKEGIEAVFADLFPPDSRGMETLDKLFLAALLIPIMVLRGLDDEDLACEGSQRAAIHHVSQKKINSSYISRALHKLIDFKAVEDAQSIEKEGAQLSFDSMGGIGRDAESSGNFTRHNLPAESGMGRSPAGATGRTLAEIFEVLKDAARARSIEIFHQTQHDSLTGLPNRALVNDRIAQAIARARPQGSKLAVLFLDLDHFKHINDSLGHEVGDKLLQSVGERLLFCVRDSDTVSRQAGDEFAVLLPEIVHAKDAAVCAKKILTMLKAPHLIGRHALGVSASIGISVYPDDGLDLETLDKNADTAMYQAKKQGRNSYRFFEQEMNVRAVERQSIEEDLRGALEREEFVLQYQPKVNLKTGAITGAEALIRWRHPERGLILPLSFVPIAEESGLMAPIGKWVLREACRQALAWQNMGLPAVPVAVNISAAEFKEAGFLESVRAILEETRLEARHLELELTESAVLDRSDATDSVLRELKVMGVRFTLDDFGTGYASLSYLKNFPADALKVDQSFVREVAFNPDDAKIVSAVIHMGRKLQQLVIAEGVETQEQLAFLRNQDCDEGQGYYFSPPVHAEQFARLLEKSAKRKPSVQGVFWEGQLKSA